MLFDFSPQSSSSAERIGNSAADLVVAGAASFAFFSAKPNGPEQSQSASTLVLGAASLIAAFFSVDCAPGARSTKPSFGAFAAPPPVARQPSGPSGRAAKRTPTDLG